MSDTTKAAETFTVGQRVRRHVDSALATVTSVCLDGKITDVEMDDPTVRRDAWPWMEIWHPVVIPTVGMPCSQTLVTDTTPAVVVKVNKKSIVTARVLLVGDVEHDRAACQCTRCTGVENGSYPVTVQYGDPTRPIGAGLTHHKLLSEGRYDGVTFAGCFRRVDHRM